MNHKGITSRRRLKAFEVVAIRKRIAEGEKLASIAYDFKVSMTAISHIKTGRSGKRCFK